MKYIKLFEEWSPNFNKTLQAALVTAQETRKGFGKVAQDITDYAQRQISKEIFTVKLNGRILTPFSKPSIDIEVDQEVKIMHKAEVLLKPVANLVQSQKDMLGGYSQPDKNGAFFNQTLEQLLIPVLIPSSKSHSHSIIYFVRQGDRTEIKLLVDIPNLSSDGLCVGSKSPDANSMRNSKAIDLRFSDRASLEDFLAMIIQSILSSNEEGQPAVPNRYGYTTYSHLAKTRPDQIDPDYEEAYFKKLPGMTREKQDILEFIQINLLDKDIRHLLM